MRILLNSIEQYELSDNGVIALHWRMCQLRLGMHNVGVLLKGLSLDPDRRHMNDISGGAHRNSDWYVS